MQRSLGVILILFFSYLIWLYFAIYESSINNWWTVIEIKQRTEDTLEFGVSNAKVFAGTAMFTFSGVLIYLLLGKRN